MKEIAQAYDKMLSRYSSFLEEIQEKEVLTAYTNFDFFSFQPFWVELNHIAVDRMQFYGSIEELEPQSGEKYLCFIENRKLIFARNDLGGEISYDSFFIEEAQARWRYQFYVNGDQLKPVSIELLRVDSLGKPLVYESYGEFSYEKMSYEVLKTQTLVHREFTDPKQIRKIQDTLDVRYSSDSSIQTITAKQGDSSKILFDRPIETDQMESLVKNVVETLYKQILEGTQIGQRFTKEITFILMEYTMQGPFPPSLALAQSEEVALHIEEGEDPLLIYNAPDLLYFSENDSMGFNFDKEGEVLFDTLNQKLDDMDFEEAKEIVSQTYIGLCKRLSKSKKFKSYLSTSENFHVTARDFEECNEWEMLQKTLPERILKPLKKRVKEFEKKESLTPEEFGIKEASERTLSVKFKEWLQIKDDLENQITKKLYASERLFFLEPYRFETQYHRPSPYKDFLKTAELMEKPLGDYYYEYGFNVNGDILFITYISEGVPIKTFHYQREGEIIKEYHAFKKQEDELESYAVLEMDSNIPIKFQYYGIVYYETVFLKDKQNNLTATKDEWMFHGQSCFRQIFKTIIKYNGRSQIHSISTASKQDQIEKSSSMNHTYQYCYDDSFINDAMNKACQGVLNYLLETTDPENFKDAKVFVLEKQNDLPLYQQKLFSIHKLDHHFQWRENTSKYLGEELEKILSNFSLYTSSFYLSEGSHFFEKDVAQDYINRAYDQLARELQIEIKRQFKLEAAVLIQEPYQSIEAVNSQMEKLFPI